MQGTQQNHACQREYVNAIQIRGKNINSIRETTRETHPVLNHNSIYFLPKKGFLTIMPLLIVFPQFVSIP